MNHIEHNHGLPHQHGNTDFLLDTKPSEEEFFEASDIFSLICDSTRLKILWLLCHTKECVSDIAIAINMSSPAVSHHLRILKQAGLITSERLGKEMLYTLSDTKKAGLVHQMIDDIFQITCPNLS